VYGDINIHQGPRPIPIFITLNLANDTFLVKPAFYSSLDPTILQSQYPRLIVKNVTVLTGIVLYPDFSLNTEDPADSTHYDRSPMIVIHSHALSPVRSQTRRLSGWGSFAFHPFEDVCDPFGGLCTTADPVIGAFGIDSQIFLAAHCHGVKKSDPFDKPATGLPPLVGNDDRVKWSFLRAAASEPYCDHAVLLLMYMKNRRILAQLPFFETT